MSFCFSQIFFSEYAEGSGYNKYLEIYNADDFDVDLTYYSLSTCSNGCDTMVFLITPIILLLIADQF
jgi:predicted extracellular nuclease